MKLTSDMIKQLIVEKYNLPLWYLKEKFLSRTSKYNTETNVVRTFFAFAEFTVTSNKEDTEVLSIELMGNNINILQVHCMNNDLENVKQTFDKALAEYTNGVTRQDLLTYCAEKALLSLSQDVLSWCVSEGVLLDTKLYFVFCVTSRRYSVEHIIEVAKLALEFGASKEALLQALTAEFKKPKLKKIIDGVALLR